MKKPLLLVLFWCLLLMAPEAKAQLKTWPLVNLFFKNQFDKNGNHHGRWVFITEEVGDSEKMTSKGRYKNGLMVGDWKTYSERKQLRKLEKSQVVNGTSLIATTEFYLNGNIKKKGVAVLDKSGPTPRFYLRDEWSFYLEDGRLDKKVLYEEGWGVKTTYADGKVIKTPAPPKILPAASYHNPSNIRKGIKMIRKGNELITIHYKENGDSTVQITPINPVR